MVESAKRVFSQDDSIIRLLKAQYNLKFLLLTSVIGDELIDIYLRGS